MSKVRKTAKDQDTAKQEPAAGGSVVPAWVPGFGGPAAAPEPAEDASSSTPVIDAFAASAQAGGAGAPAPEAPAAAPRSPDEHTIFVDGTWQTGDEPYWKDEVQEATHDLFGSSSGETFSWYNGPNDERARDMAGRKLYHEAVLPALEDDKTINLMAHSHGGNVVGEMGAYMDHRRDHTDLMHRAATGSGVSGLGADIGASLSIGTQLAGLGLEAMSLSQTGVERYGTELEVQTNESLELTGDSLNQGQRDEAHELMMAQLGEEAQALIGDGRAALSGDADRFASEREALAGADFGDAVFAQTPFLEKHANPLESEILGGSLDRVDAFFNPNDSVVYGAQNASSDPVWCPEPAADGQRGVPDEALVCAEPMSSMYQGEPGDCDRGRTLLDDQEVAPGGPEVHEHTWSRPNPKPWDIRFNHAAPINSKEAFEEEYSAVIQPERFPEHQPDEAPAP